MFLLRWTEFLVVGCILLFMVTQVIFPVLTGTPLFPILRHSNPIPTVSKKIDEATEQLSAAQLEVKLHEIEAEIERVRHSSVPAKTDSEVSK